MGKGRLALEDESLLDQLIKSQRSSIRFHLIFAAAVFFLGIVIISACLIFAGRLLDEGIKVLIGIGSGFVSSLSALQLKEILQCRNKIGVYENVQVRLKRLSQPGSKPDGDEPVRIKALLWKIIEQTATG
jgi:hypothetical protein